MDYQTREARTGEISSFMLRMPPVVTREASTQVVKARVGPNITVVSCSDGRHHGVDAKDVDGPPEIIDERGKAELGPDILESLHQEGTLVHPLLDATEGMFDGLHRPHCGTFM